MADRGNSLRTSNANVAGGCFGGKGTFAFKVDLTRPGIPRGNVRYWRRAAVQLRRVRVGRILPNRGPGFLAPDISLEAFAIPERQSDAVAEGIEKVVLAAACSIANAKPLDLVDQVIS